MNKNSLELFSLLSENSHVTDEQMQNAYKSFVEQITTISQSQQSYPEVFRMLNRTRIELDSLESSSLYELEKKQSKNLCFGDYFLFDNIHNTSYSYPYLLLHPPISSTSDKQTTGRKRHKV